MQRKSTKHQVEERIHRKKADLPPAQVNNHCPVCPELKDLWEHGVFITNTGTVLSKQGQLVTLSAPCFFLRGNTVSFLSSLPKILLTFSTFISKPEYELQSINLHLKILLHHSYFLEIKLNLTFFIGRVIQEVTKCSENKIKALTSLVHRSCCFLLPKTT